MPDHKNPVVSPQGKPLKVAPFTLTGEVGEPDDVQTFLLLRNKGPQVAPKGTKVEWKCWTGKDTSGKPYKSGTLALSGDIKVGSVEFTKVPVSHDWTIHVTVIW